MKLILSLLGAFLLFLSFLAISVNLKSVAPQTLAATCEISEPLQTVVPVGTRDYTFIVKYVQEDHFYYISGRDQAGQLLSFAQVKAENVSGMSIPAITITVPTVTATGDPFPAGLYTFTAYDTVNSSDPCQNPVTLNFGNVIPATVCEFKLVLLSNNIVDPIRPEIWNADPSETSQVYVVDADGHYVYDQKLGPGPLANPRVFPEIILPKPGIYRFSGVMARDADSPMTQCKNSPQTLTFIEQYCNFSILSQPKYYVGAPLATRITKATVGKQYKFDALMGGNFFTETVGTSTHFFDYTYPGSAFPEPGTYILRATDGRTECDNSPRIIEVILPALSGRNPCVGGSCNTALGILGANMSDFTNKILTISFGIVGAIALIFMVMGAIRMMTSSGDQQKLNGGREIFVAALAGLLFILLSVVILRFIVGPNFLNLPGF